MAILSFSVSLSAQRKGRLPVSQSSEESPACMFFSVYSLDMDHPKLVLIKLISKSKSFWRTKWTCRA